MDRDNFQEVLQSSRVFIVQEIKIVANISEDNMIINIFQNILPVVRDGCSQIKRLEITSQSEFERYDLSSMDPVLFSQVLIRLEECWFDNFGRLSTAQLVAVLTAIEETKNLTLKRLYLPNEDYSEVPPELLAAALVKLEDMDNIFDYKLSPNLSAATLLNKMAESPIVNIQRLTLSLSECFSIPPELFGDALVKIKSLVLFSSVGAISEDQVLSLFRKISHSEQMRLRELTLFILNISHISADIISEATIKLKTFMARSCRSTSEQVSAIFAKLSTSQDHKLRILKLPNDHLSSVSTQNLVGGISGLETADLSHSRLTTEQLTGIYRMVADRKCSRLRKINIEMNGLSSISSYLRERAKLNESVKIIDKYELQLTL